MAVATRAFHEHTAVLRGRIEQALEAYTQPAAGCPSRLAEALRYSLLAGGKRLRPMLVLLSAEACGSTIEAAMPAACAVEMVHTYSLIHDDLPAMDDDALRRGRPTNHIVFGEALAILAGDGLLTLAFEVLASGVRPGDVAAACCVRLAAAAGVAGMVGGQADDIDVDDRAGTLAELESLHARKTGDLLTACLQMGGLISRADAATVTALTTYGRKIGLAFQIVDDLLDVRGDAAAVGKRVGKDSDQGKLTFPALVGIDASRERAAGLIAEAQAAVAHLGTAAGPLVELAQYVLERDR